MTGRHWARDGVGQEAQGHLAAKQIGSFIATLMDSKGVDLAVSDMPGTYRLMLHVLAAAAEHE